VALRDYLRQRRRNRRQRRGDPRSFPQRPARGGDFAFAPASARRRHCGAGWRSRSKIPAFCWTAIWPDPPELIEQFVAKWKEGFDVVYGRRRNDDDSLPVRVGQRLFYRMFNAFSYLPIPRTPAISACWTSASLRRLLQFPERDLFIRGVRAFAGFRQVGVDYRRARVPRRAGSRSPSASSCGPSRACFLSATCR